MYSAATGCRSYDPAAISNMAWAFEKALASLSLQSRQQPHIQLDLAVCIFRLFNEGETTPSRLARLALANVTNHRQGKRQTTYFNSVDVPSSPWASKAGHGRLTGARPESPDLGRAALP